MLLFRQPHARARVLLGVRLFSSRPSALSAGPRRNVAPANDDESSPAGVTRPTWSEIQTTRYQQRYQQRHPPSNARSAFVPSAQPGDLARKKDAQMQDRQEQDAGTPDAHAQDAHNQDAYEEDEQAQDVQILDAHATGSICEKTVERLSCLPFSPEVTTLLHAPLTFDAVAAKPTGKGLPPVPYLPEIRYRRILNKAFGAGAWTLLPAGPVRREGTVVSRDYQMFVFGRLVSEARGYQEFFHKGKTADVAVEGIKSNALMRCCKDLGIASELWDPDWIREWQSRQPCAATNAPPSAKFRDNEDRRFYKADGKTADHQNN